MAKIDQPKSPIATPVGQQRNRSGRKRYTKEYEPRHPGHRLIWRRNKVYWDGLRQDPHAWHAMIKAGANESHGSVIGRLYIAGRFNEVQASAAQVYAIRHGRYDRLVLGIKRHISSPAYDRGFGRDDELARRERDGTINDYEKAAKRATKQWNRIRHVIPSEASFNLLDRVLLEGKDPRNDEIDDLVELVDVIARSLGFYETSAGKIGTYHLGGAKHGTKGRATWTRKKSTQR